MSNKLQSVSARLGHDLLVLNKLKSDEMFSCEEDQSILELAIGHLKSAQYCLYDIGLSKSRTFSLGGFVHVDSDVFIP